MTKIVTFEMRADGVGMLWLDVVGAKQNTIKPTFRSDLEEARRALRKKGAKAVVLASKKPGSFMAGGDIEGFKTMLDIESATARAQRLQDALNDLEASKVPVVAAIDGICLGGGLEIALACHSRVASDARHTKIGLPEVQLGLLPAGGGTQRLPRTVGLKAALDLMLTGKQIDGRKARKIGLVSDVVAPGILIEVAAEVALKLADHHEAPSIATRMREFADPKHLKELALAGNPAGRKLVFDQAHKMLLNKAGDKYPAPNEILKVTRTGLEKGMEKGLEAEARAFGQLMVGNVSRRLVNIFFATTALKQDNGTDRPDITPQRIQKVGILGAGIMGHGIAAVTVGRAKTAVRLKDQDDAAVARGLSDIATLAQASGKKRGLRPLAIEHELLRVSGTTDYSGFKQCEVVIEAVCEDLHLKHEVLAEIEQACSPDTIFASNTSSIPITEIAAKAKRPENVIGMHYFSPVPKMPLLEVIRGKRTSDEVVATCVALGKRQGKTVIVVNDGVGFYTSRILGPYLNEATYMLMEGIPIETIDAAAREFGFPVGPLALLDEVGIDTSAKIAKIAAAAFKGKAATPDCLQKLVADHRTGRKGKRGFYLYGDERLKSKTVDPSVYAVVGVEPDPKKRHDLTKLGQRLALPMINEAIRCLDDDVLRSARDGDIGAIFGLGFPAFEGGPFRYADAMGPAELLRRTRGLEERLGARFTPPEDLVRRATSGRRFHDVG